MVSQSAPRRRARRRRRGVVGEPVGGVARLPAALVLQRLREVPVEQRRHRRDAALVQAVDQPLVEVQAALVDRADAVGHAPAARRWRSGSWPGRGSSMRSRSSASGGSGRRPRRRCHRRGPCRGRGRRRPRPSLRGRLPVAPSIWYAEVAAPQTKPSGKRSPKEVSSDGSADGGSSQLVSMWCSS